MVRLAAQWQTVALCILQKILHQISVQLLAPGAPVGADGFRLLFGGHSESQVDDGRALFQHPAAGGVFAISGGIIISRNRDFIAQLILVFFQIFIDLFPDLGGDFFPKNSRVRSPSSVME